MKILKKKKIKKKNRKKLKKNVNGRVIIQVKKNLSMKIVNSIS